MITDEIRALKLATSERLEGLADRLDEVIELLGRLVVSLKSRA